MIAPDQLAHQAIGQIVEVVQPLAQVGIGLAHHAGAIVGLDALDRGLGGQAGHDRLVHLVHPAAVVREHAIGLEHVAVLAAVGDVAALQHHVEVGAQRVQRGIEPLQLLLRFVGDQLGHDDARLMQHHMAEPDAVGDRKALELQRTMRGRFEAGLRQRGELARRNRLGEHHRGGLQRLFLVFRVGALRAVLHHQHAERIAGAQDRDAEERVIDFFAGFRAEREGRMVLRVRQVERLRLARDQADQAFVLAQHGDVHRLGVEALGGVKFERAVDPQHVQRADFRHHVGGDQHHDPVEAILRADRLRHDLAKPAQQHARTTARTSHDEVPCVGRGQAPGSTWLLDARAFPAALSSPYSECDVAAASRDAATPERTAQIYQE